MVPLKTISSKRILPPLDDVPRFTEAVPYTKNLKATDVPAGTEKSLKFQVSLTRLAVTENADD